MNLAYCNFTVTVVGRCIIEKNLRYLLFRLDGSVFAQYVYPLHFGAGVSLDCPSNVTAIASPGVSYVSVSWAQPIVNFQGPRQPVTFSVGSPPTQATSDTEGRVLVYSDYQLGDTFHFGATLVTYRIQGLETLCQFSVIVIGEVKLKFVSVLSVPQYKQNA